MEEGRLGVAFGIQGWAIILEGAQQTFAFRPVGSLPPKAISADGVFKERRVRFNLANRGGETVAINVQPLR